MNWAFFNFDKNDTNNSQIFAVWTDNSVFFVSVEVSSHQEEGNWSKC